MKKAFTATCLLLILTAVSFSPCTSWAAQAGQRLSFVEDPSLPNPSVIVDDTTKLMGDPDDAITGNRNNGLVEDDEQMELGSFKGISGSTVRGLDDWLLLLRMLDGLGLI